ncbi:MAG: hypothetical protein WA989_17755, partial [Henriciella sp.]|uniref:hypothetical protein n=1 Tax=Henriciella sp. TaxID=1968823 RepID=UPI003C78481A
VMTAQNKIDWVEKDNGEVIYATEGYVVRLTAEPPRVLLTTESGKPLEDATTTLLKSAPHADGGTYGDVVASIARQAYREARGTEDAINTLLAGLSEEADTETDASAEAETKDETEPAADVAAVSAEALPEEAFEDAGDDTEILASGEIASGAADETEEDVTSVEPVEESDAGPAAEEDLVDASVPEAALLGDTQSDSSESTQTGSDQLEDDAPVEDEDDVSGAVARLAGEVNAASADGPAPEPQADAAEQTAEQASADADEPEAEDPSADPVEREAAGAANATDENAQAEPAPAEDTDTEADADSPSTEFPSFSVMPDHGQSFDIEDDETEQSVDTLAQSDLPADAPEDATLGEVTEAAEELADNSEETGGAVDEADTSDEMSVSAEASDAEPEASDDAPAEPAIEDAAGDYTAPRYVPFGAGGLAVAGADLSAEAPPTEDDVSSELGAASTGMTLPDEAVEAEDTAAATQPDDTVAAEPASAPDPAPAAEADVPEDVVAVQTDQTDEAPPQQPPVSNVMSINTFSAGLGFGARSTGFTPSSPREPGSGGQDEQVTRSPVVIDATDDYPADFREPPMDETPEVAVEEGNDSFLTSPAETLESVSETPESEPGTQTAEASPETAPEPAEEETAEESEPVRPKTRFNPWT